MTRPIWRRWYSAIIADKKFAKTAKRPTRRPQLEELERRDLLAAFTAGDLVIYRVGDGQGSLVNTGNAVFLDEYTPTGTLVQSVALPTSASVTNANNPLIASGTATSEGLLTRSADGRFLVLTGYDRALGGSGSLSGTSSTTVPRTVGIVDASAGINTSTALTDFASANNPRSATSSDGTNIWVAGAAGGVRYTTAGSTTSTDLGSSTLANIRQADIFGGQLYVSSNSGSNTFKGVETVGTGLPTSGTQTITRLPGLSDTNIPSPNSFAFADLDGSPGPDTLYVADDTLGLLKFSLVNGTWVATGTAGNASDAYRGLTIVTSGGGVTLYATRNGGGTSTGGGQLVSLTDASGYDGTLSGTPTVLATAANDEAFRGVALAPVATPEPDLTVAVAAPANAAVGVNYTYTLTAFNDGTAGATNVAVQFTLPSGVTFVSAAGNSSFTFNQSGGVVTFSGGSIAAGASASLTVAVKAASAGTVVAPANAAIIDPTNTITESNENNNGSSSVSTAVADLPDLTIAVSGPTSSGVGSQYLYTLTPANMGTASAAGIAATFTLPSGVTFNSASGTNGFTASQSGGVVTFTGGSLNAGTSATLTVAVTPSGSSTITVAAGAAVIDPANTITESNEANNASTGSVSTSIAGQPDLFVINTGPAVATAGTAYSYTVFVGNSGNANANGVSVSFRLPTGVTFNSASGTNGFTGTLSGGTVTFTGGVLNANASASLTISVIPTGASTITSAIGAAVADPGNTLNETNENNNTSLTPVTTFVNPVAAQGSLAANPDTYAATGNSTLTVNAAQGLFANDQGAPLTVITNTDPGHGSVTLNADGSFNYTPTPGYTGTDSFTYTVSNAVQLYSTNLPPLAVIGGVPITAGAYGSALYPVPGSTDEYYGLEDRGPNVTGPDGVTLIEPLPSYDPAIGKFKFVNGQAILEAIIPLTAADGTPYSGLVNSQNSTGETIEDLNGVVQPTDPNGYDPEGLVALPDGTFWVSDEYGPFITHFDATGKQIGRLTPFDGTLPVELRNRVINRGLEGLTLTPDGTTLVATMQSSLQQPDLNGANAKKITILRLVTYKLATGEEHEYLYMLDNPASTGTAVSEITALSDTTFLVDERDGNFPPGAYKKLYVIDITGATDIGPNSPLINGTTVTYDNGTNHEGLLINGKSLEKLVNGENTAASLVTLNGAGITVAAKSLYLDVGALLDTLSPQGKFFSHDKIEGVAALNGGLTLVLSNDSDFGVASVTMTPGSSSFTLVPKVSPTTGQQDDGQYLVINLANLPARTSTATVSFTVNAPLAISPTSLPATTANHLFTSVINVTGGTQPYSQMTVTGFSAGGTDLAMPAVNADAGTVTFNSTPTAAGSVSFTVNVTDSAGATLSQSYSLTVNPAVSLPASLPSDIAGTLYNQSFTATGGTGNDTLALSNFSDGGTGLAAPTLNGNTFTFNSTPNAAETVHFTITATDAAGATAQQTYDLTILAKPSITGIVFSDDNADGTQDNGESGVANATVYLDANNNGRLDTGEVSTTTGGDGHFTLANLPAGTFFVRINAPDTATTSPLSGTDTVTLAATGTQTANFGTVAISPGMPFPFPSSIFQPPTLKSDANADLEAFIRGLYHSVLNRDADPSGLSFWMTQFNTVQTNPQLLRLPAGSSPFLYVSQGIWTSQEHRWLEVESYYHTFLGRDLDLNNPQDVADRQYWANQFLFAGKLEADVIRGFLTAPEFLFNHATDPSLADTLNALLLAGTATPAELQTWRADLSALDAQRAMIISQTFPSADAYKASLVAQLGAVDDETAGTGVLFDMLAAQEYKLRALDSFYIAFIHRTATPSEEQMWLNDRDANGKPLDLGTIAELMLQSPQYRLNGVNSEV